MSALVTIIDLPDLPSVAIARGRLETDGITCFIKDEYAIQNRQVLIRLMAE